MVNGFEEVCLFVSFFPENSAYFYARSPPVAFVPFNARKMQRLINKNPLSILYRHKMLGNSRPKRTIILSAHLKQNVGLVEVFLLF